MVAISPGGKPLVAGRAKTRMTFDNISCASTIGFFMFWKYCYGFYEDKTLGLVIHLAKLASSLEHWVRQTYHEQVEVWFATSSPDLIEWFPLNKSTKRCCEGDSG